MLLVRYGVIYRKIYTSMIGSVKSKAIERACVFSSVPIRNYWTGIQRQIPEIDALIEEFNDRVDVTPQV